MRVRLTLAAHDESTWLPLNYNFSLASMIHNILKESSSSFITRLENDSARVGSFRLFTFSRLKTQNSRHEGDRLLLGHPEVSMQIASPVPEFIEQLLRAFKKAGALDIGGSNFRFVNVLTMRAPRFKPQARFRALSPITVETRDALNRTRYLGIENDWSEPIRLDLQAKYRLVHGADPPDFKLKWLWDQSYLSEVARQSRRPSVLTHLKGARIRGWLAPFEVEAPPEMLEIGYDAGFGSRNWLGFGMAELMRARDP